MIQDNPSSRFWSEVLTRLETSEGDSKPYKCAHWPTASRTEQRPPEGDWAVWLVMGGRGLGKTWTGAGWITDEVKNGRGYKVALMGETAADVRDVMIEGESGILASAEVAKMKCKYFPSKRRVIWPDHNAQATAFSAEDPYQSRGFQHDRAWCDEIRSWNKGEENWDTLMLTMRLGDMPKVIATSTPLPLKWIKELIKDDQTVVTKGSTYNNLANLSPLFQSTILRRYEGTRLGRQEIEGEMIEDVEGALWTRELIDATRIRDLSLIPQLRRVAVGVDPPGSTHTECGIVGCGSGLGFDGSAMPLEAHAYVIADYSRFGLPPEWGSATERCYHAIKADMVIAEANYGGEMVRSTLNVVNSEMPVKMVTATRGKKIRAEPPSALWEQGRGHIVGSHPELEDEMCNWTPDNPSSESPNRMDAMVWAVTWLIVGRTEKFFGRA